MFLAYHPVTIGGKATTFVTNVLEPPPQLPAFAAAAAVKASSAGWKELEAVKKSTYFFTNAAMGGATMPAGEEVISLLLISI